MSIKAFRWAKKEIAHRNDPKTNTCTLSSPEAFVLLMIADHYNDEWGRAWPSQATLARETGLSTKTVGRAVDSLRALDLVESEQWVLNERAARLQYRYLLPSFNHKFRAASRQPVLAFAASDSPGARWDQMRQIPGSNLFIEEGDLD